MLWVPIASQDLPPATQTSPREANKDLSQYWCVDQVSSQTETIHHSQIQKMYLELLKSVTADIICEWLEHHLILPSCMAAIQPVFTKEMKLKWLAFAHK